MRLILLLPLAALILGACASPRERCLRAATNELQVLDGLIAETEGNIARGYAITREVDTRTVVELCAWPREDTLFCTRQEAFTRDRPQAVDMAAERRKLEDLRIRRASEARRAAAAQAVCPAA
ncbi:hypothetical protein HUK65_11465 [Rhodobacteraceae bacterium 2376]|uniref:Lipoprotein n=1 Tax=Rhabdonatronobacter sediminivivens TaxID=2743469 RepID=A0A7Z0KYW0_9RHOB|nr:hypothetical protein [Rhabdonatronobacter sediminivivens]NYS25610.1 hypothetical protein [Rhabdonatronobacter sediminivivens]